MKSTDQSGLSSESTEPIASGDLPPGIAQSGGDTASDDYEAGKTNNNVNLGGDGYIDNIVGPSGPKTVAKTHNPSIRGGYVDQR